MTGRGVEDEGPGRQGFLVTLEGGDGSGKSTQAKLLVDRLRSLGRDVLATREPGGTGFADAIRGVLMSHPGEGPTALAELLAFNAARADHLERLVRPALSRGAVVVIDRYMDSTRAYQGARSAGLEGAIGVLESLVVGPTRPDLTLVLDLPIALAMERRQHRRSGIPPERTDPFEAAGAPFQERLRAIYLEIAESEPERCILVDAARDTEPVAEEIARIVEERLARRPHRP